MPLCKVSFEVLESRTSGLEIRFGNLDLTGQY